jgi:glutathione S-transferase
VNPRERTQPRLVGRSSSSFTRVARIFAAEAHVSCELTVVRDLLSLTREDYGGNPALKLPILHTGEGGWFGALNICRILARSSSRALRVVWPEDLHTPLLANAQELTVHALATEVSLVMSKLGAASESGASENAYRTKLHASLENVLAWLDSNLSAILAALPAERDLSYLEVTLFCLLTHLEFRQVLPVTNYAELAAFCLRFGERASARETPYFFDS